MLNTRYDIITAFVGDGRTQCLENDFRQLPSCIRLDSPFWLSSRFLGFSFVCRHFYCWINTKQKLSYKKDVGETVCIVGINNIIISSFGAKQRKITGAFQRTMLVTWTPVMFLLLLRHVGVGLEKKQGMSFKAGQLHFGNFLEVMDPIRHLWHHSTK